MKIINSQKSAPMENSTVSIIPFKTETKDGTFQRYRIKIKGGATKVLPERISLGIADDRLYFLPSDKGFSFVPRKTSNTRFAEPSDDRLAPFAGEYSMLRFSGKFHQWYVTTEDRDCKTEAPESLTPEQVAKLLKIIEELGA